MRILVADDSRTSRVSLEQTLQRWGLEVLGAADGAEAWAILTQPDPPPIALLDWEMPHVEGPELCRRIRSDARLCNSYVLILTARDGKEHIVEALDAGADDFISKPCDRRELQARIGVGQRVVSLHTVLGQRLSELEDALRHVKTLQGILPICMHCHRIRDDREAWNKLESYIVEHSSAQFTHSLCPDCLETHYPEPHSR